MYKFRLQRTFKIYYPILCLLLFSLLLIPKTNAYSDTQTIFETTGRTDDSQFGRPTGYVGRIGFRFVAQSNLYICSFSLKLSKYGGPTDNVKIELFNGDTEGYSLMSSKTISSSEISVHATLTLQTFTFDNCLILGAGNTYLLVISRTGTLNNDNYYYYENRNTDQFTWTEEYRSDGPAPLGLISNQEIVLKAEGIPSGDESLFHWATQSYGFTDKNTWSLAQSIFDGMQSLFIPDPSAASHSFSIINSYYNSFKNKPPFGWISLFTSSINILQNGTADNPLPNTPSYIKIYLLGTNYDLIELMRNFVSLLLTIAVIIYLFHRIRRIITYLS